ncbi:MAG: hypothetical protein KH386_13565 [Bacteroides sp.]|nr:hypothetical protein [Bacteroides sp.]
MAIPKKRLERIKQLEAKADAKYKRIKKRYGYEFSIDKRIASEMSAKQAREYEKYLEEYTSRRTNRFVNLGNVYVPASDVRRLKENMRRLNKLRREEFAKIKDKPIVTQGKERPTTVAEYAATMAPTRENPFYNYLYEETFNPETIETREQFERLSERVERQSTPEYQAWRKNIMYQNFIDSLNYLADMADEDISDILEYFGGMSFEDFYMVYMRNQDLNQIFINTKENWVDVQRKIDEIRATLNLETANMEVAEMVQDISGRIQDIDDTLKEVGR